MYPHKAGWAHTKWLLSPGRTLPVVSSDFAALPNSARWMDLSLELESPPMLASHLEHGDPWLPAVASTLADADGQKREVVQIRQPRRRGAATRSCNPATPSNATLCHRCLYGIHLRPSKGEWVSGFINQKCDENWDSLGIIRKSCKKVVAWVYLGLSKLETTVRL